MTEQERLKEIEEDFRLLGLDSDQERDRLLRLSNMYTSEDEPRYRLHTGGDTKDVQEEVQDAKLESDPQHNPGSR